MNQTLKILTGIISLVLFIGLAGLCEVHLPRLVSDGMILQRDNGSIWQSFGPLYKFVQPPAAASFTAIAQSGVTLTDQGGNLLITCPYTAAESRSAFYIAQSSTWSVTTAFKYFVDGHNAGASVEVGLGFINSGSGKWSYAGFKTTGGTNNLFSVFLDNNAHTTAPSTVAGAFVNNTGGLIPFTPIWIRISYGATDRTYEISLDGVNFQLAYTQPKDTTFVPDAAALIVSGKATTASNTNMGANLLVNVFDWH